jgi:anti-anti-sigma factor
MSSFQRVVAPPGRLDLSVERSDDVVVVRLRGELDLHSVSAFEVAVEAACRSCRRLVIDLRALHFIDSSGLHGIMDLRDRLAPGAELLLVRGSASVHRTFGIVGLDQQLTFVEGLD